MTLLASSKLNYCQLRNSTFYGCVEIRLMP
jgi:hypothetical protein